MSEIWGKPSIPPPIDLESKCLITRFSTWVESLTSTPKGHYKMVICLTSAELYKALLMAEAKGVMLHLEVYAPDMDTENVDRELMALMGDLDQELLDALDMTDGSDVNMNVDWEVLEDD